MTTVIRPKDRDAVIQSLRAGVVPRSGQHLIQVGRNKEIEALVSDIERIADGGSGFRVVIGEYGSGKTFFLNLVRAVALEKKLVVASADLNPDRRLHASGGQARSLYAELMRNLSTRTKPDGGALGGIVEKFIATAAGEAKAAGQPTETVLRQKLEQLTELVNGYDFADVIAAYYRGFEEGNQQLKTDAVRWLRGEFSTRTDARQALGVRTIVDDSTVYDQLKLLARFVRLAGFSGLLVSLDELVNLYKLANTQARNSNYEQILRILNDSLQGTAVGLAFVLGGTPEFLLDTRRGLYSYPALQSRLSQNTFVSDGLVDFSGPVLRLSSLTPEDFYVLLQKVASHSPSSAQANLDTLSSVLPRASAAAASRSRSIASCTGFCSMLMRLFPASVESRDGIVASDGLNKRQACNSALHSRLCGVSDCGSAGSSWGWGVPRWC
jgi:hypothetical protein